MTAIFEIGRLMRRPAFISYPKSGRTWMRYVLRLAGTPRVRFSHGGYGTSLPSIGLAFTRPKIELLGRRNVFMHRNPIDTAVSMYFQIHKVDFRADREDFEEKKEAILTRTDLPPEDIEKFVLHPVWGVLNIVRFNAAWLKVASEHKFFVGTYEEFRKRPGERIAELFEFLRIDNVPVDQIVKDSSFDAMKDISSKSLSNELRLNSGASEDSARKVRRGVIKGYVDYLGPDAVNAARRIASEYGFEA